jgi:hypothetical protein
VVLQKLAKMVRPRLAAVMAAQELIGLLEAATSMVAAVVVALR